MFIDSLQRNLVTFDNLLYSFTIINFSSFIVIKSGFRIILVDYTRVTTIFLILLKPSTIKVFKTELKIEQNL